MSAAKKTSKKVYIALGSNISPEKHIPLAIQALNKLFGGLEAYSSIWQTPAVGSDGPDFLNAIVLIQSEFTSDALKKDILRPLEVKMGRKRIKDKNASRTIDLDVLIYEDQLLDEEVWQQVHMAVPLAEIHPDYVHPESGKTITQIAKELSKKTKITRIELEI